MKTKRFVIRTERRPERPPTGWRGTYEVIDTHTSSNEGILIRRCWSSGEAYKLCAHLNDKHDHAVAARVAS